MLLNKKRIHLYSALVLTLIFYYPLQLNLFGLSDNLVDVVIIYIFKLFALSTVFLAFYSNAAGKVRLYLFGAMAFSFVFWFMSDLYLQRGHIGILDADLNEGLPFCHIAIVNNLLSVPLKGLFVSPSKLSGTQTSIYSMLIIWLFATILLGKGFCSWGCFYGGWDSFFSSLRKKNLVKIKSSTNDRLLYFPYAFLISIAILSVSAMTPLFCAYLCPFKTITEFQQVTDYVSWLTFMFTVVTFFTFTIIIPLFVGKRIWCNYLCPFGALQCCVGKVFKPFKIKLDQQLCINCAKCVTVCKSAGITETSLKNRRITANCSLCLNCVEACPQKALTISAYGSKVSPIALFSKISEPFCSNKILTVLRTIILNLVDDILNPTSFMIFFGLAVLYTFFSGFYFQAIYNLIKIFGSG